MPFKSDAQRKLCYLLKGKGQAGSWDCDQWSKETKSKDLPEHVGDKKSKGSDKEARCWEGYKPVPGKKAYSEDSCMPVSKEKKKKEGVAKLAEVLKKKLNQKNPDLIPGGKADNKSPSDFPQDALQQGFKHEKEHTSSPDIAKEIAMDHLTEDVDYYEKLKKIEKGKEKKAMSRLVSLWSRDASITKLSEVVASPQRGAGDKDDGVTDLDPTEGMPKPKQQSPGAGVMPLNKKLRASSARKALISATKNTFGVNPTGGNFGKKAEGPLGLKAPAPSMSQGLAGAAPAIGNAFKAGFGNEEAYSNLKQQAAAPSIAKGLNDWKQTFSALGQTAKQKAPEFVSGAVNSANPGMSPTALYNQAKGIAASSYLKDYLNKPSAPSTQPGMLDKLKSMGSSAYEALPKPMQGIVQGAGQGTVTAANAAGQGVANQLSKYEGGRMAANAALPVVDFFRNNPWAKYLAGGLGLYGGYKLLSSLFGGGQQQAQGDPVTAAMQQGYAGAMR